MSVNCLPVFALLAAWPPAAVAADDFPKRQAGLWVFDSPGNRLVKGALCVDDTHTNFVETDIWSNFARECVISDSVGKLTSQEIEANCQSSMTGKVKLTVTYDGDFTSRYHLISISLFEKVDGKDDQLILTVDAAIAEQREPEVALRQMTDGHNVIEDYSHTGRHSGSIRSPSCARISRRATSLPVPRR